MSLAATPNADTLRHAYDTIRADHPQMRIRQIASKLAVSEMDLVAAGAGGLTSQLLTRPPQDIFRELGSLGQVMALTRNDWCVHERHGQYEKISAGKTMGLVLGPDIDLRMFFACWDSAWAVNDKGRHSIQFFDKAGTAIHKIFCTDDTDMPAYQSLIHQYADPTPVWPEVTPATASLDTTASQAPAELRTQWLAMKDTHEFHRVLKDLNLSRLTALRDAGSDLAQKVDNDTAEIMLNDVVAQAIPFMCFVGNHGMVQIHSGPIGQLRRTGPWFNVLEPHFNLHLDTTAIAQTWIVNRPSSDGWITSLECFTQTGELIVQFFGARKPGVPELAAWRALLARYCPLPLAA